MTGEHTVSAKACRHSVTSANLFGNGAAMQELSEGARFIEIAAAAAAREAAIVLETAAPRRELFSRSEVEEVEERDDALAQLDIAEPPQPRHRVVNHAPDRSTLSPEARAEQAGDFIRNDLVPRLRRELSSANPNARMAALNGLVQLGDAGLAALPDIWKIANDPEMVDGRGKTLRGQVLGIATHMAVRAQRRHAARGPSADDRLVELLAQRALTDTEPQVHAKATRSLIGLAHCSRSQRSPGGGLTT